MQIDDALKAKLSTKQLDELSLCLAQDPRPAYQKDGRIYGMAFDDLEVKFVVNGDVLTVTEIK